MKKLITFAICLTVIANVFAADNWHLLHTRPSNSVRPRGIEFRNRDIEITYHHTAGAQIFDKESGRCMLTIPKNHPDYCYLQTALFSHDGTKVVIIPGRDYGLVKILDTKNLKCLGTLWEHRSMHPGPVSLAMLTHDSTMLLLESDDSFPQIFGDIEALQRKNAPFFAFALALHARLGTNSPAAVLNQELIKEICTLGNYVTEATDHPTYAPATRRAWYNPGCGIQ